jgi:hypothetical protein
MVKRRYELIDEAWSIAAHEVVKEVAQGNQYIVSDIVIAALEQHGLGLDNYSSLGGVFIRAANDGILEKQETSVKSSKSKTVWRSLIYKKRRVSK